MSPFWLMMHRCPGLQHLAMLIKLGKPRVGAYSIAGSGAHRLYRNQNLASLLTVSSARQQNHVGTQSGPSASKHGAKW